MEKGPIRPALFSLSSRPLAAPELPDIHPPRSGRHRLHAGPSVTALRGPLEGVYSPRPGDLSARQKDQAAHAKGTDLRLLRSLTAKGARPVAR
jgi:hypothetical protein